MIAVDPVLGTYVCEVMVGMCLRTKAIHLLSHNAQKRQKKSNGMN